MSLSSSPFGDVQFRLLRHPVGALAEDERTAVESYALGNYERINGALRGWRPSAPDIDRSVGLIRSALGRFPLEADARVSREASCDEFGVAPPGLPEIVGQVFEVAGRVPVGCQKEFSSEAQERTDRR